MEYNVLTLPLGTEESLLCAAVENPFDLDVHLPEYMPDVQRILKCTVTPNILSVSAGGDRVTAEGSGVLRLLYATEDKKVVAFEQTFPISRSAPFQSDDPQSAVTAIAQTDFVNCRATGQKRADVHGVVSIRFSAKAKRDRPIVVGTADDALQMRTKSMQAWSVTAVAERAFSMSEVVEVGEHNPAVGHILRADASVQIDSMKAVKDKMLIKGQLTTEILYQPDGDGEWVRFSHTMPLSQILEVEGVSEEDLLDVSLRIASLETTPKADGSGELRLLEIALRIFAGVRTAKLIQMQAVTDAYSTHGVLQPKYGDVMLRTSAERFSETVTVRQTVDLAGEQPSQLLDVSFDRVQSAFRMDADTAVVDCAVSLGLLFLDAQGAPAYMEKQLEFSFRKILSDMPQAALCSPIVQITGCKGMLGAQSGVDVRLEALVSGTVYAAETDRLLLDASIDEAPSASERSAMTIYYADAGESLWDIARRYGTTVAAVQAENGMSEESVNEKRMLVIPTI